MNRCLLVTTDSVQGSNIKSYLGIVSARVVAGTGLFREIAAEFRDVWGGRSGAMEQELAIMQRTALDELGREAQEMGANCVLGTRIDYDEISGKRVRMLMATASGTAVVLEGPVAASDASSHAQSAIRSASVKQVTEFTERIRRLSNQRALDQTQKKLIDEVASAPPEIATSLLIPLSRSPHAHPRRIAARHLGRLGSKGALARLHDMLEDPESDVRATAATAIGFNVVRDNPRFEALAESADIGHTDLLLRMLLVEPQSYSRNDLEALRRIISWVESRFIEPASRSPGSEWKCACGRVLRANANRCRKCGRDRTGFRPNDPHHPAALVNALRPRLEALELAFEGKIPRSVAG